MSIATSRGPKFGEAPRRHRRAAYNDATLASQLFDVIEPALRHLRVEGLRPIALNPMIRVYAYSEGDVFGKHYDESNDVGPHKTEYTLLIYLCGSESGMLGGETAFYDQRERELSRIVPFAGSALLHAHGHHCVLHEAMPVTRGTKWVLRSDVVFGV
jgi:hypothetical protein